MPSTQQQVRPPIIALLCDHPAPQTSQLKVQELLSEFPCAFADCIVRIAGMEEKLTLTGVTNSPKFDSNTTATSMIVTSSQDPGGHTTRIGLSTSFLARAIESMFGGKTSTESNRPGHSPTELEIQIAEHIGTTLVDRLKKCKTHLHIMESAASVASPEVKHVTAEFITTKREQIVLELSIYTRTEVDQDRKRIWHNAMNANIQTVALEVTAISKGPSMAASELAQMAAGSVIEISGASLSAVSLECDQVALFRGTLGHPQSSFAITIDGRLS